MAEDAQGVVDAPLDECEQIDERLERLGLHAAAPFAEEAYPALVQVSLAGGAAVTAAAAPVMQHPCCRLIPHLPAVLDEGVAQVYFLGVHEVPFVHAAHFQVGFAADEHAGALDVIHALRADVLFRAAAGIVRPVQGASQSAQNEKFLGERRERGV